MSANTRYAFLDGARGWAAVVVLLYHVFCDALPATDFTREHLRNFVAFNGPMAVSLFFLISGFALSIRFVQTGDRLGLLRLLVGRYPRLVIPIFAISAMVFVMLKAGWILPVAERHPGFTHMLAFDPTITHLVGFSLFDVFFSYRLEDTYAGPLWTMSIELIGSFWIIGVLVVAGRTKARWLVYTAVLLYLWGTSLYYYLFIIGILFAEVHERIKPNAVLALALLVAATVLPLTFQQDVQVWNIAAACLFCAIFFSPWAQRALSTKFSQKLGDISFPLYLVHGPIIWLVGLPLLNTFAPTSAEFFFGQMAIAGLSILAAFMFKPVNELSIAASRTAGRFTGAAALRFATIAR